MAISLSHATLELGVGAKQWEIIVGFLAAVALAVGLGYRFGRWYCTTGGEKPTFELVFCPVVVFILASFGGSALACLLMALENRAPAVEVVTGLPVLTLYGVIVVVATVWPAIVVSHVLAGLVLARLSRSAPNNSSKPTPLRGAA